MQATGTPRSAHRLGEHAEPAEVGDVEHDDHVGAAKLFHRLGGAIDPGQSSKRKSNRAGVGVGLVTSTSTPRARSRCAEPDLAAEPVAVGIDVGGETDPLPRLEELRRKRAAAVSFSAEQGDSGIVVKT